MSLLTPPRKKRIKRVYRHPNLLFQKWLQEWCDEAKAKDSQMKYNYARALKSLKSFPLPLYRGADCKVLSGFGDKICQQIDRKLQKHIEEFGPVDWESYHQVVDHSGPRKKRAKKRQSAHAESIDPDDPDDPDDPQVVNRPAPRRKPAKKKTPANAEMIDPDDPDSTNNASLNTSRKKGSRPYVPAVRSGAYAILMAFHQAAADEGFPDHLKRGELMELAQEFCDASFTQAPDGSHYTAWSSMSTLIRKNLISKEGSPARYALTVSGEELCARLASADEGGNRQVHISQELEHQGTASADNICIDPVEQRLPKRKKAGTSKKPNRSITNEKSEFVTTEENKGFTMSSKGSPTENAQNDWSNSDPEDLQDYYCDTSYEESTLQKNPDVIHDESLLNNNRENKQTYTDKNSKECVNELCSIASDSILEEFGNCSLTDSSLSQSSLVNCVNRLIKKQRTDEYPQQVLDLEEKITVNTKTNEESLQISDVDITVNTEKLPSVEACTVKAQTSCSKLPCIEKVTSHLKQNDDDGPCAESHSSISGATTVADYPIFTNATSSSTKQTTGNESDIPQLGAFDNISCNLQSEKENLSLKNNNVSVVLKPRNSNVCENGINNNGEYNRGRYLNGWITVQDSNLQEKSSRSNTCLKSESTELGKENENEKVVKENDLKLERYLNGKENEKVIKENDLKLERYLNVKENEKVVKENDLKLERYLNGESETKMMMKMMMDAKNKKYERKDRMEGTHKYKKYRGKNEKKDFRNNDLMSEDMSKENKNFSYKTKRRRKRKKSESSSEEEIENLVPEIIDVPKQPQPAIVAPAMCPISTTSWKNFVFFDLETTSLSLDCDIVQIAAIDGYTNDTFNLYVKPTKKMDKMASFITRISFKKGILRHNFKPVYASPAPKALERFLFWIKQRSPVTLVAHNASFDSKRLFYALNLYKLTAEYKKHTIGFVDTLPLFKRMYPRLPNHKQETIVKHVLNIEYDAHNALEDVKSLKEVYHNTFLENSTPNLKKSSTDFASAHEQWLYEWEGKKSATTFSDMVSKKCVSGNMADKMANSGLTKGNLEFVYKSKGVIGIENLLGKIGSNGKPRISNNKKVINEIVKYFALQSD